MVFTQTLISREIISIVSTTNSLPTYLPVPADGQSIFKKVKNFCVTNLALNTEIILVIVINYICIYNICIKLYFKCKY